MRSPNPTNANNVRNANTDGSLNNNNANNALGLSLNSKTQIHPVSQGIVFLKWRFVLTATGKAIMKMNPKSVSKERRKLRKLKLLLDSGKISMRDVRDNYRSWKANAKRGNTRSLVLKMDEYYRELFKEGSP